MVRTSLLLIAMALAWPAGSAQAAGSQAGTGGDGRWLPWFGCWVPAARPGAGDDAQVCIVPDVAGGGVRMITFAGDREILSETIVADGNGRPVPEQKCTGERTTRWSQSGRRLFSASTAACEDEAPVKTSAVASLISSDSWLDVQVINTGGREQVRTRRLWRSSSAPPAPLADILAQAGAPSRVSVSITADDVIEASGQLPPSGVEAWLVESGIHVPVDRRMLVRLSDAHVAENVIDLMIALAFPRKFEVHRAAQSAGGELFGGTGFDVFLSAEAASWSDYGAFGWWGGWPADCCHGGYFPWDGWYDIPDGGGGGGGSAGDVSHGQVVNGKGYTRVEPRETAERRSGGQNNGGGNSSAGGSSESAGGSSGGDAGLSSASPAGYSGGGGTSTGLTAVPR